MNDKRRSERVVFTCLHTSGLTALLPPGLAAAKGKQGLNSCLAASRNSLHLKTEP